MTKTFEGITEDLVPSGFTVTPSYDGEDQTALTIEGATHEEGTLVYTWTLEDVPYGTEVAVTESGTDVTGWTLVDATIPDAITVDTSGTQTIDLVNPYEKDTGILKLTKEAKGLKETETVPDSTKFIIRGTPVTGEDFDDIEVTYADIKNGDWFVEVPVGKYEVISESGAKVDGYLLQTTLPDAVTVEKNEEATLTVINVYVTPVTDDPPVLKQISNDTPDKDEEFTFLLKPVSNTAGLEVEDMPMPEGNEEGKKTAKAGEKTEFGTITFMYAGTYVYTIEEDKTSPIANYKYDDTVYTVTYVITQEGTAMQKERIVTKGDEVVEDAVFVFTNEYNAPPIDIPVEKVWDTDSEVDPEFTRPKSITVVLLADEKEVGKTLELNAENGWKGTFEKLPAQENGKKITYTIKEVEVKYYTSTITGDMYEGFVITNVCTYIYTGDDSHVLLWSASMMASMAGIGFVLKKKREEEAE